MELNDCAFPQLEKVTCTSDANVAFGDADYVLLVGAAPEKLEWSEMISRNQWEDLCWSR